MNNKYKVIISSRNLYREVELPLESSVYRIGTSVECEYRLNRESFFEDIKLEFSQNNGIWKMSCIDNLYISEGDSKRLLSKELRHGNQVLVYYVETNTEVLKVEFIIDFDNKTTKFERRIDLSRNQRILIGGGQENDIILRGKFIQNDKIELVRSSNGYNLQILNTLYGVNHNGNRAAHNEFIKNGDFISIANFIFYCKDNALWMKIDNDYEIRNLYYNDYEKINNYPRFTRNTRVKMRIDKESIKILDPDNEPVKPQLNLLTSLMPAVVMFALVIVLRGFLGTSTGTYVLFSICSMGMGVITSILNIRKTQKKYKEDCEHRIEVYQNYIGNKRQEIEYARVSELDCLRKTYYSTEENLQNLQNFTPKLFDKLPDDDDFLEVYLGIGKRKAQKEIDYKLKEKLEIGDDIAQWPSMLSDEYKYIEGAPITLPLREANAVGVVGNHSFLYEMFKNIMIDLVSRHYYGDVNIYTFIDDEQERFNWIRFLPHLQNGNFNRNIVCDNQSKNNVFERLYKELTYRSEAKKIDGFNVILVMNEQGLKRHPISQFIEKASELNTVFIFFENREELLPLYCSSIIRMLSNNQAVLYETDNQMNHQEFVYSMVQDYMLKKSFEVITPVYCEEISLEGAMRRNISLFELLDIFTAEDLDLKSRWSASKIYDTMAAPLGVNVKDEIVYLDLHEKYHGPHGLVAGTTGSGKSEILQAYILSAATIFHPYEIGFVIIDFKGGGMVNQFKELPHLIGAITNIDGNEIQRSLKSIKAELIKRQNYFASAGVNHVDKYIQLYKEGKVREALPHLVIIVDEFAELKLEQPEFMKELVSAARIGRSLGVHLILATQKPSGVVDPQIWSNSKFKLCLKVQSKEDSNEVIKTPLAAEIKEPGRAYLQVGNNEMFELFQSAFSGAPAIVDDDEMGKSYELKQVSFTGVRTPIYVKKKQKSKSSHNMNQLESTVKYISEYCEKENIIRLPSICLPPLSSCLPFVNQNSYSKLVIEATVGIYDNPDQQLQREYKLDVTSRNYMIIGSAQTGKTNILQTIIRSIAENYTAKDVNMYIIDFGSMILKNFAKLSHVGGVVCSHEDEKLKSLFRLLSEEIIVRKAKLAEAGVSSFVAYKEAGQEDLPQIVVFVDNLTALKELYLQENDLLLPLCRDGIAVGVSFVVANVQTAGIGYRYLNNFEGRIALFCNETSEYNMLFEGGRIKLPSIEGRSMVQLDKVVYECQMYLAFEGEKEFERVGAIREFVQLRNQHSQGYKAKYIPEIPQFVTEEYISEKYDVECTNNELVLGLDFATVLPVEYDVLGNKFLVLSGKRDSGMESFAKYLVDTIRTKYSKTELFILDDMAGKWRDYEALSDTEFYTSIQNTSTGVITELGYRLKSRYEDLSARQLESLEQESWIVLVVESAEVIVEISKDKLCMQMMKDIFDKYYEMKVFILFSNVSNSAISFNAPELLKSIKEHKRYIIFDDICNIKLTDIPLSLTRKYTKPLEKNDAYMVVDTEVKKIRVII